MFNIKSQIGNTAMPLVLSGIAGGIIFGTIATTAAGGTALINRAQEVVNTYNNSVVQENQEMQNMIDLIDEYLQGN